MIPTLYDDICLLSPLVTTDIQATLLSTTNASPPFHSINILLSKGFISASNKYFYNASVKSLLSLDILAETLRSIVLSPISTTKPPRISGLIFREIGISNHGITRTTNKTRTLLTTLSVLLAPTYCDLEIVVLRRSIVFESSCYANGVLTQAIPPYKIKVALFLPLPPL